MRKTFFLIFALLILFSACKKSSPKIVYTIQGQVLESSDHPVPVTNYILSFYQKANSSLLGGVAGLNTTSKTGQDGRFSFQYQTEKNYGITSGTNLNQIFISGADHFNYKDLDPQWNNIPSEVNIDLNRIYLFKKIHWLVRKIQFNNALSSGDSLEVISTDSSGASYKTLYGPIDRGSLVTVDTIADCKLSKFDYQSKQYIIHAYLKKPSFLKGWDIILGPGDEQYMEILMPY